MDISLSVVLTDPVFNQRRYLNISTNRNGLINNCSADILDEWIQNMQLKNKQTISSLLAILHRV